MRFFSAQKYYSTILLILLTCGVLSGQPHPSGMNSKMVLDHFDPLYRIDARLINGDYYQDPSPASTAGSRFFGDSEWKTGSVVINGVTFDNLKIRYDICGNEIVLNLSEFTGSGMQIALDKNRISSFVMGGSLFIPEPQRDPKSGVRFCQVLTTGPLTLLLLQTKTLTVPSGGNTSYRYETFTRMTLLVKNESIRYKNQRSLFQLFPQLKPQLQEFIRTEQLRFGSRHPESHARLVQHCNTLLAASE